MTVNTTAAKPATSIILPRLRPKRVMVTWCSFGALGSMRRRRRVRTPGMGSEMGISQDEDW